MTTAAALPEDQGLVPSTMWQLIAVCNFKSRDLASSSELHTHCIHTHGAQPYRRQIIHIYKIKINKP